MTDCCKSGPKTKMCTRKSDKKTFTFPRRFSKKHCLTKKINASHFSCKHIDDKNEQLNPWQQSTVFCN